MCLLSALPGRAQTISYQIATKVGAGSYGSYVAATTNGVDDSWFCAPACAVAGCAGYTYKVKLTASTTLNCFGFSGVGNLKKIGATVSNGASANTGTTFEQEFQLNYNTTNTTTGTGPYQKGRAIAFYTSGSGSSCAAVTSAMDFRITYTSTSFIAGLQCVTLNATGTTSFPYAFPTELSSPSTITNVGNDQYYWYSDIGGGTTAPTTAFTTGSQYSAAFSADRSGVILGFDNATSFPLRLGISPGRCNNAAVATRGFKLNTGVMDYVIDKMPSVKISCVAIKTTKDVSGTLSTYYMALRDKDLSLVTPAVCLPPYNVRVINNAGQTLLKSEPTQNMTIAVEFTDAATDYTYKVYGAYSSSNSSLVKIVTATSPDGTEATGQSQSVEITLDRTATQFTLIASRSNGCGASQQVIKFDKQFTLNPAPATSGSSPCDGGGFNSNLRAFGKITFAPGNPIALGCPTNASEVSYSIPDGLTKYRLTAFQTQDINPALSSGVPFDQDMPLTWTAPAGITLSVPSGNTALRYNTRDMVIDPSYSGGAVTVTISSPNSYCTASGSISYTPLIPGNIPSGTVAPTWTVSPSGTGSIYQVSKSGGNCVGADFNYSYFNNSIATTYPAAGFGTPISPSLFSGPSTSSQASSSLPVGSNFTVVITRTASCGNLCFAVVKTITGSTARIRNPKNPPIKKEPAIEKARLHLNPNPAAESIQLNRTGSTADKAWDIVILDAASGMQVRHVNQEKRESLRIDVSGIAPGMYLVRDRITGTQSRFVKSK